MCLAIWFILLPTLPNIPKARPKISRSNDGRRVSLVTIFLSILPRTKEPIVNSSASAAASICARSSCVTLNAICPLRCLFSLPLFAAFGCCFRMPFCLFFLGVNGGQAPLASVLSGRIAKRRGQTGHGLQFSLTAKASPRPLVQSYQTPQKKSPKKIDSGQTKKHPCGLTAVRQFEKEKDRGKEK